MKPTPTIRHPAAAQAVQKMLEKIEQLQAQMELDRTMNVREYDYSLGKIRGIRDVIAALEEKKV